MKTLFLTSLCTIMFALSGCATRPQLTAVESENAALRQQLRKLQAEQTRLSETVRDMQQQLSSGGESERNTLAETRLQMREVSTQVQVLSDRLEDALRRLAGTVASQPVAAAAPQPGQPRNFDDPAPAESGTNGGNPEAIYQATYQDLVNGKFDLAVQGFQGFLQRFPTNALADNAQYWIGEAHYARQQYAEAELAFNAVIAQYPDGDKVSAALLKLAYTQIATRQLSPARRNLQRLIDTYPQSNEASLARSRLSELK